MFNICIMNLGKILPGVIAQKGITQAELIRKMHSLSPEIALSTIQGAVNHTINRESVSSKYLTLMARALGMTAEELVNWTPDNANIVQQTPASYASDWPFGKSVSPAEYRSLSDKQKEIIVARIVSFLDANSNI